MDVSKQPSASLHVARILTLVIAVAGMAWVVIATQRRANRARIERLPVDEDPSLPEAAAFEPVAEFPELAPIETEIDLPEPPEFAVDLPFVPMPRAELLFGENVPALPELKLDLAIEFPFVESASESLVIYDRFIGSSKSAVFMTAPPPLPRQNKRHGKP